MHEKFAAMYTLCLFPRARGENFKGADLNLEHRVVGRAHIHSEITSATLLSMVVAAGYHQQFIMFSNSFSERLVH